MGSCLMTAGRALSPPVEIQVKGVDDGNHTPPDRQTAQVAAAVRWGKAHVRRRLPANCSLLQEVTYIGRGDTRMGFVGVTLANPHSISSAGSRHSPIKAFRAHLFSSPLLLAKLHKLTSRRIE